MSLRHAGIFNFKATVSESQKHEFFVAYSIHSQHDAFVKNFFIPFVEDFMEIDTEHLM